MTSYLIKSGDMPFTGAEVCAELGIDPSEFGPALDDLIALECCNSASPVTKSVWWVSEGPRFDQEVRRGNCPPTTIGASFPYEGGRFRECTYLPRDWAVAIVRKAVIEKACASDDVNLARAIEAADERKRASARVELREQLVASVELSEVA